MYDNPEPEMFEGDALDYLQAIYQGRIKYDPYRFRAANAAVAYERPKLAVAAVIHPDGSFAERLEKAITRSNGDRLALPTRQVVIDHQPSTHPHDASELSPGRASASGRASSIPRRRL